MPRALTIKRTIVTKGERPAYLERVAQRAEYYRRAGCHLRVFEEVGLSGAFIEFFEAADAATLAAAHAGAAERMLDAARVYREVETS